MEGRGIKKKSTKQPTSQCCRPRKTRKPCLCFQHERNKSRHRKRNQKGSTHQLEKKADDLCPSSVQNLAKPKLPIPPKLNLDRISDSRTSRKRRCWRQRDMWVEKTTPSPSFRFLDGDGRNRFRSLSFGRSVSVVGLHRRGFSHPSQLAFLAAVAATWVRQTTATRAVPNEQPVQTLVAESGHANKIVLETHRVGNTAMSDLLKKKTTTTTTITSASHFEVVIRHDVSSPIDQLAIDLGQLQYHHRIRQSARSGHASRSNAVVPRHDQSTITSPDRRCCHHIAKTAVSEACLSFPPCGSIMASQLRSDRPAKALAFCRYCPMHVLPKKTTKEVSPAPRSFSYKKQRILTPSVPSNRPVGPEIASGQSCQYGGLTIDSPAAVATTRHRLILTIKRYRLSTDVHALPKHTSAENITHRPLMSIP